MTSTGLDPGALRINLHAKRFAPPLGEALAPVVLQGVAFRVEPGETVALIGPSGCGKTTLLNIFAGLEPVGEGRLEVAPGARVAYVFQEPRLLPWRTVGDNLALVLDDGPDKAIRIERALASVGLEHARDVYASRLSLGMARRVALGRGFIVQPDVLLLDEPFVSLDEPTAARLRLLLLELLECHRTTAVLVTHRVHEAIMLAERLLILSGAPGRLLHDLQIDLDPAARRSTADVGAVHDRLFAQGLIDVGVGADG